MRDKKKTTAIIAAVAHYIQTAEAAAAQLMSGPGEEAAAKTAPSPALNLWGVSGRHQQMQMRTMVQMKAFHGSRPKF